MHPHGRGVIVGGCGDEERVEGLNFEIVGVERGVFNRDGDDLGEAAGAVQQPRTGFKPPRLDPAAGRNRAGLEYRAAVGSFVDAWRLSSVDPGLRGPAATRDDDQAQFGDHRIGHIERVVGRGNDGLCGARRAIADRDAGRVWVFVQELAAQRLEGGSAASVVARQHFVVRFQVLDGDATCRLYKLTKRVIRCHSP